MVIFISYVAGLVLTYIATRLRVTKVWTFLGCGLFLGALISWNTTLLRICLGIFLAWATLFVLGIVAMRLKGGPDD